MEKVVNILSDLEAKYFKDYLEFYRKKELIGCDLFGLEKNKNIDEKSGK